MKLIIVLILGFSTLSSIAQEQVTKYELPFKPKTITNTSGSLSHPKFQLDDSTPSLTAPTSSLSRKNIDLDYKPKSNNSFINKPYAKFILPSAMIAYGTATRFYKPLRDLDYSTDHELGEHYPRETWVDDYLQFAPAVAVFGLDLVGVPAKHNFRDRVLVSGTSYLIMGMTVQTMKQTIKVQRPSNGGYTSFPSGHTATTFVGAHILMKEYLDVSPWIGIAGYTAATGVGVMRMINHKHWISDVVMGAGIGILSVELGYMILPIWHNILGIKDQKESLVFIPSLTPDFQGNISYGMGMSYNF